MTSVTIHDVPLAATSGDRNSHFRLYLGADGGALVTQMSDMDYLHIDTERLLDTVEYATYAEAAAALDAMLAAASTANTYEAQLALYLIHTGAPVTRAQALMAQAAPFALQQPFAADAASALNDLVTRATAYTTEDATALTKIAAAYNAANKRDAR